MTRSARGLKVKELDSDFKVIAFELQSRDYVHFRRITKEEGMKRLIPPAVG